MSTPAREGRKLRVLLSGHLPPPMGGMAAYYQALLASSLPARVDLQFVQTSSQSRALANSGSPTASNILAAWRDCARFARAALRMRPQVAHIGTAYGLSFAKHSACVLLARLLGSRVLLHPHCAYAALYAGRSRGWRWYVRQVLRLCDGVVVLSREWEPLRAVAPGCRVHALPNAIDRAPYAEVARDRLAGAARGQPLRALYLGYLGRAKGCHDLVEAARELQATGDAISFDLVGDELAPGELAALQEHIVQAGVAGRVKLRQAVFGAEKLALLREAHVMVYPSYHEGMPMAVLEAMACALPVVATRVGGLPDLVVDGANGLLVEPGHPEQLAAALRRIAAGEALRQAMGARGYQVVLERFDLEQRVDQLVAIYGAVVGRPAKKREERAPSAPQKEARDA